MDDAPLQALHVPELPVVQNVFPGGVDASTHTPSSAALLYSAGARSPTKGSLSHGRPGEGVSTEHWGLFVPVLRKIV